MFRYCVVERHRRHEEWPSNEKWKQTSHTQSLIAIIIYAEINKIEWLSYSCRKKLLPLPSSSSSYSRQQLSGMSSSFVSFAFPHHLVLAASPCSPRNPILRDVLAFLLAFVGRYGRHVINANVVVVGSAQKQLYGSIKYTILTFLVCGKHTFPVPLSSAAPQPPHPNGCWNMSMFMINISSRANCSTRVRSRVLIVN